jgi:hypothetical protein
LKYIFDELELNLKVKRFNFVIPLLECYKIGELPKATAARARTNTALYIFKNIQVYDDVSLLFSSNFLLSSNIPAAVNTHDFITDPVSLNF